MVEEAILEVFCDADGCAEKFSGFTTTASERFKEKRLTEQGWIITDDGEHYCPGHKQNGEST